MSKKLNNSWWSQNKATYQRVKAILTNVYPKLFNSSFPLPLSDEVKRELIAKGDPLNISEEEFNIFFKFWTSRTPYLETCKVTKGRYDLECKLVRPMDKADIASAEKRLQHRNPVLLAAH